jgi:hypothetical protein
MRWITGLLLAAACGSSPDGATDQKGGEAPALADPPSEYVYTPEAQAEARFDADALEAILDEYLTGSMVFTATPVMEAYGQVLEAAEPGCPDWYEVDGNTFWYAYCSTSTGTSFDGYGFYTVYDGVDAFGDGNLWELTAISGSATVRDNAGHTLHIGGDLYDGTGLSTDGARLWVSQVAGAFLWDGPGSEGSWLAQGGSPSLLLYAIQYELDGQAYNYLYETGAIAGLAGGSAALQLNDVSMAHTALGYACAAEPMGTLSVRDSSGHWWEIRFDLDDRGRLTGDCDGCGGVFDGETYVGEVCADFSPMLDWERNPW